MYDVELYPSFRERMDRLQDRAAWERYKGRQATHAKVTRKMPANTRNATADELAAILGVSGARVRVLLASGRVQGAYRARKGRNHPWVVPLYREGKHYLPRIAGPPSRKAEDPPF